MNNLCIIPARGGSKRIPRKNIKNFLGKPIIAYSIETALESFLFDEVMVSTDDHEIARIAKHHGAKVPFMRSRQTSDDYATTIDVVKEVIDNYKDQEKYFDQVCVLYPTAPFVRVEHLKEGIERLKDQEAVIPVTGFGFPVWRAFNMTEGKLSYQWPQFAKSRSQDLEELYHDAGQWYFIKTESIKDSLVPNQTASIVLTNLEVQDIDTLEDWRIAELKYEYLQDLN